MSYVLAATLIPNHSAVNATKHLTNQVQKTAMISFSASAFSYCNQIAALVELQSLTGLEVCDHQQPRVPAGSV